MEEYVVSCSSIVHFVPFVPMTSFLQALPYGETDSQFKDFQI
jgi:hypothetical protein